ncbi:MAG TPA: ParB/RepB/Spo0J family partition protein [Anaerolineales bacterium]|nr:ParB/RepB/Spo0J family partition protein [Anaerolineales bacterium]
MNMHPPVTSLRSRLSDIFSGLQSQARRRALWSRLTGRIMRLEMFPEEAPEKSQNRTYTAREEISLKQIIGTLSRQEDFDRQFRPLKRYLRDRWVSTYLTLEREGWEPILVHKVGDRYYVEDGHHRVSVARWLSMTTIPANVWEYPVQVQSAKECHPTPCPEVSSSTVYVGVTD